MSGILKQDNEKFFEKLWGKFVETEDFKYYEAARSVAADIVFYEWSMSACRLTDRLVAMFPDLKRR